MVVPADDRGEGASERKRDDENSWWWQRKMVMVSGWAPIGELLRMMYS